MPEGVDGGEVQLVRWHAGMADGLAAAFIESEPALRAWIPSAASEQENAEGFIALCAAAFAVGSSYAYAVVSGGIAGYCNVTPAGPSAKLAYWIRSGRTRQGLGTAAVRALTDATFAAIPALSRIEAHVDSENKASRRVAERAGYRLRGSVGRLPRTASESTLELVFVIERGEAARLRD